MPCEGCDEGFNLLLTRVVSGFSICSFGGGGLFSVSVFYYFWFLFDVECCLGVCRLMAHVKKTSKLIDDADTSDAGDTDAVSFEFGPSKVTE